MARRLPAGQTRQRRGRYTGSPDSPSSSLICSARSCRTAIELPVGGSLTQRVPIVPSAQLPRRQLMPAAATISAACRSVARRRAAFADEILRLSVGSTRSRRWPQRGDQPFAAWGWQRSDPHRRTIPDERSVNSSRYKGRATEPVTCAMFRGKPTSVATGCLQQSRIR